MPVKNGQILIVDLAALELRVLAYVSLDEILAQLFSEEDPHTTNASLAFGIDIVHVTKEQRNNAKTVIYKLMYGGRAITDGEKTVENLYKVKFKKAFSWVDWQGKQAQIDLEVTDPYGKTRNLREVLTWRGKGGVKRAGINSPIQGVGSHIAMQVTYNAWWLFRKFKLKSKIIFGVHDSVVGDIHPSETDIAIKLVRLAFAMLRETEMYKAFPLAKVLPMEGDIMLGPSWGFIDANEKTIDKVRCSSHDTITEDEILCCSKTM